MKSVQKTLWFLVAAFVIMAVAKEDLDALNEKLKDLGHKIEKAVETEGDVIVLTEDNFDQVMKDNRFVLVEFYAPWCGHCKKLAPEFEQAAKSLLEAQSEVKLGKVDATIHKDLGKKFDVKGYPTLKFFRSGQAIAIPYDGPRDAEGILGWLEKKTGPPATEVSNAEDVKESGQVVAIGFFKERESDDTKRFLTVAEGQDVPKMLITSSDELFKEYEVKEGAIVMIKPFDESRLDYSGEATEADLKQWLTEESRPLIWEFTAGNAQQIFGLDVKVHFLFFVTPEMEADDKEYNDQMSALRQLSKEYRDKMVFVFLKTADEANAQILDYFGIKKTDCPMHLIYEMETNGKFLGNKNTGIVLEDTKSYLDKYFANELEQSVKSQDVPEDWDSEGVKVLVGKNFEKVAMDKTKDVFIEFYAPWCGHCKQLAPIWDKLAEQFEDDESIVIAKMDSTANEISQIKVQGFPTLKMIKKDSNQIVDYNGERDLDSLVHFVKTGIELKKEVKPLLKTEKDEEEAKPEEEEPVLEKKDEKEEL